MPPPGLSAATATDWSAETPPPTPFWQRVPKFFLLPLDKAVALRILTLAAVTTLAPLVLALGFIGLLLLLLLVSGAVVFGAKYGFTIIERSAQGFLRPSDYPAVDFESSWAQPFRFVGIYVVFFFLCALVWVLTGGSELASSAIGTLLTVVVFPAVVIRLVSERSLPRAFSPPGLLDVVVCIGKPYIGVCVFLFFAEMCRSYGLFYVVVGLSGAGGATVAAHSGVWAGLGTTMLLLMFLLIVGFWYFTYVMCAIIGYVMYQYADKLGVTVIGPGETAGPSARRVDVRARRRDVLLAQMVAAGNIKEAIELISDELRERPQDLSLHARLHKLLLAEGYPPRIDDHTDKYLDLLMRSDNAREALPLVEEALQRRADWEPRHTEHVAPLARAALAANQLALAARLIRGFDRRHKAHPDVPAVYLVGAQLMLQQGGAALPQARQILQHLISRHPADPAAAEGQRILERLDRLAGTSSPH